MLLNSLSKYATIIILLFLAGIFNIQASEVTMVNKVYETTYIEQSRANNLLYEYLPNLSDANKALVDEIKSNYSIGIGKSLSSFFKEAEWILTSDGIVVVQLALLKTSLSEALKLKGTYSNQNGITQLHVTGTERHGLKITIDGILQPNDNGFHLDGIFTASVRDARHVERIVLSLGQNLSPSENKWGDLIIDEIRKTRTLKNDEKPLLSETTKWIGGVPVPTIFDVDMMVKLDGTQLDSKKGQLFLYEAEGFVEPTVGIMLTTEGGISSGWSTWKTGNSVSLKLDTGIIPPTIEQLLSSIQRTSQSTTTPESDKKVTANNGRILVTITPAPPFREVSWHIKNPEHPDEDAFVLVDDGTIDIQLDKEGKKILSGTIKAQGKVLAGNRPVSIFSAKLLGKQQGKDLVERIARDVGARPFDGRWYDYIKDPQNNPKIEKLVLTRQSNKVSGKFSGKIIEEGIVTDSVLNLLWKTPTGELRKSFLSAATDGLLVGMSWNENLSFEPVIAIQIPTDKLNSKTNKVFTVKNDAQSPDDYDLSGLSDEQVEKLDDHIRELKFLGNDLSFAGKHEEAAKILLQVIKYYKARETLSKNNLEKNPTTYQTLRRDLINQVLPLNRLIWSTLQAGDYKAFFEALRRSLHVQNELQKSKADLRSFLEQSGKYIADINKSAERMKNLKDGYDRGITALSASGIGIDFDKTPNPLGIEISSVRLNMPASRAGVAVGDLLVAIDGVSVAGMSYEKASIALRRGNAGSSISIRLLRDGQYRELKLVRAPLINMSSEQREELTNNMKAIRDFVDNTGKYYHDEVDKLVQLSKDVKDKKITDVLVAVETLTASIKEHQNLVEYQRSKAIELTDRCLTSPLAHSGAKDEKIDEQNILQLDQEEETFKKNPDVSEMDKSLLSYSIIIANEFDTLKENMRSGLQLIEASFSYPSSDEVETANTLAGLTGWLDIWRTRMVTDAAKIKSLNLGQGFYTDYVQILVEMNLPEQALQASEIARARAFADLLARSHTATTSKDSLEIPLTSLASTKTMTIDEIRQLVRDTGITVVEYFVLKDGLLTWVIKPPNSEFKDVQLYQISQQVINGEVIQITKQVLDGKVIQIGEPVRSTDKVIRDSLQTLKKADENKVDKDKPDKVELTKVAKLVKLLSQENIGAYEQQTASELKNLYDILIAPIERFLLQNEPDKVVTIIPHDDLFRVPFAALARSVNQDGKVEHYLVENHALTYAPSLAVLNLSRQMKREPAIPSSLLAVVSPTLGKNDVDKDFESLPTVEQISKTTVNFYNPKSTLVLSGLDATQAKVLTEAKSRDVLLFYTHAKAIDKDPLASYIAVTKELLTAETISKQHLNARLAILAACQTGRGEITGDGVQGVARMFVVAGAKNVMVSLWSVSQEATLELMKAFHQAWKNEGQSIAASLRQAQIQLLKKEGYPQVPLWAGFIIIGDGQ